MAITLSLIVIQNSHFQQIQKVILQFLLFSIRDNLRNELYDTSRNCDYEVIILV